MRGCGGVAGLLLGCALVLGACRDPAAASGTALYVTAEFDASLVLTQLEVAGSVQDDGPIGPQRLPPLPERFLHSGETLRVLLPSAPEGALAEVRLSGLSEGRVVATGTGSARLREGYEVEVTVRLASTTPTGDGGDGGFCPDCPEGCCIAGHCATRAFNTCGSGGVACVQCDARTSDSCLPQGVCGCGTGPACETLRADRCEGGACRCGTSAACGAGQACVNGQCRCTATSCPSGCCSGDSCVSGREKGKCGQGGQTCRKCERVCNADGTCD